MSAPDPARRPGGVRRAPPAADSRLTSWVSRVLAVGTSLAMAVVLVGVLLTLAGGGGGPSGTEGGLLVQIAAGKPASIVSVGLLLLVLTPAAELVAALVAFLVKGERRYVIVTALVLCLLAGGVVTATLFSHALGG